VIEISQRPLEKLGRAGGCAYLATATVDGVQWQAQSRSGAANELARLLVENGIPDQPVRVAQVGLRGWLEHRSLHRMAQRTYSEGNSPVKQVRWTPYRLDVPQDGV